MKQLIAGICVGAIVACGGPAVAREFQSDNASLSGGNVEMNGYRYNCITYTKTDRGGVWCDRIAAP